MGLVLELDELVVGSWATKPRQAKASHTRQVVAYLIGVTSSPTAASELAEGLAEGYGRGSPKTIEGGAAISDFWEAYRVVLVLPEERHEAVGKESGELAHVERWNNTLRQRLAPASGTLRQKDAFVLQVR